MKTIALALFGLSMQAIAQSGMQAINHFDIDRTEVSIGEFRRFAEATQFSTQAEKAGGGQTYEGGWVQRKGWTWKTPFGQRASDAEPAVHITFNEAAAYCRWAGKRLPTDAQWIEAAYTERRASPPAPLTAGRSYPYPTGDSPRSANCLGDCAPIKTALADGGQAAPSALTTRGRGHSEVGRTAAGVNGLHDMGGNVWEWVDGGTGNEKLTRGGSWWYGAAQMHRDHTQSKPPDTAVVYIGFRCARSR